MNLLRTGLAAGSLLLLSASLSLAADLGGERYSMKDNGPAIAYHGCGGDRFAGFYAGANIGMAALNTRWTEVPDFDGSFINDPKSATRAGAIGGVQLGYNRVRCNFLIGLEADYNFSDIGGTSEYFPNNTHVYNTYFGSAKLTDDVRNFATLRGRMGFVVDRTLFYGTGGFAWANLKHQLTDINHYDGGNQNPVISGWKQGYAIGGGFEHAVTEMISLKAEALYMDFGKRNYQLTDQPGTDTYYFSNRANVVTARIGLNVKLGDVPPRHGCDGDCGARPLK